MMGMSLAEVIAVVLDRGHLRRTVPAALVVGTVLFCINQLDAVLTGNATGWTWIKSATTYLVPFCVVNLGVITATAGHQETHHSTEP